MCESTGREVKVFNPDSTCPCECTCAEFSQSTCETRCKEQNQVMMYGSTDDHGCLDCQCTCGPYDSDSCHEFCDREEKLQVQGAKNRYGCDTCQCGCLNRDCDTECGDLEFRVKTGNHGCITSCQCICADDCMPNCHGCIKAGQFPNYWLKFVFLEFFALLF